MVELKRGKSALTFQITSNFTWIKKLKGDISPLQLLQVKSVCLNRLVSVEKCRSQNTPKT